MAWATTVEKRLKKELMELMKDPIPGMTIDSNATGDNLMEWVVHLEGPQGTLYEGEQFQLLFQFSEKYPYEAPRVIFQGSNIPVHPHVYSNGHICMNTLTANWSPALTVHSVFLSLISMLSSCTEKKRPIDNDLYVSTCRKNSMFSGFGYHGDKV